MGLIAEGIRSLFGRPQNTIVSSYELDRYLRAGSETAAGIAVTPDRAMQVSAVYACARIIAEDIGKVPYPVYKKLPDGGRERATSSPFWGLIHDRPFGGPNTFGLSSQQFRETLTLWCLLRGNGYAYKNTVEGRVVELIPIHPSKVRIEVLYDNEVLYWVRMKGDREVPHTRKEIFHMMGPSEDGIQGVSIVTMARQTIGIALAAEEFEARLFSNSARPSGLLSTDAVLDDDAIKRLRAQWEETYGGLANAHKIAILEQGLTWQTTSMSPGDAEMLQTRKFEVSEIARWFRIAPHKVGDMEHATFTNIEVQREEHVQDTLLPWAVRWDNAINQQVIGTNNVFAELLFDGLLRALTKDRFEAYTMATGGPWMTRNEARVKENLERLEGLDEVIMPLNLGTAEDAAAPQEAAA